MWSYTFDLSRPMANRINKSNTSCPAYWWPGRLHEVMINRLSKATDRPNSASNSIVAFAPRVLRLRDAPRYLGMDRNRFNAEVRPYLTKIPIGRQGVAFDRLELDAWWEQYKSRNGRPAAERRKPWDE